MSENSRPPAGWTEEDVRRIAEYYDNQSEEDAIAEAEAAYQSRHHTMVAVPVELVPAVLELIASKQAS